MTAPIKLPPGTTVLDVNHPDFAEKFADAVDARPSEAIEVAEPKFHREKGAPAPHPPPDPFERILDMSYEEIRSLGCRALDEPDSRGRVLLLFPGE
jgi:hypothetical protein